jgi:hypothetical protein
MTLRKAAEQFMEGRKALHEIQEISSDRKIGKKLDIHYQTVVRAYSGLPNRLSPEDSRLCVDLKTEQQRLRTVQRESTLPHLAMKYGERQIDIVAELERMGVDV